MKNQRSTQTHKWLGLRAVAAVLMLLMALTCCFAVSAAGATDLAISADDLLYPNYNGVYAAVYGEGADVSSDFKVSPTWKETVAPDAKLAIAVKTATLSTTEMGAATVTVTFELTGEDAASYSVGTVTVPAMVYDANPIPQIKVSDLTFKNALQNGMFVKIYDAKDALTVGDDISLDTSKLNLPEGVDIAIESAKLNAAGVKDAKSLVVTFKLVDKDTTDGVDATEGYLNPPAIVIPAKVTPRTVTWQGEGLTETVDLVYNKTTYDVDFKAKLPAFAAGCVLENETVNVISATNTFEIKKVGKIDAQVNVVLDNPNYTPAALPVSVTVNPIKLTVDWSSVGKAYEWGKTPNLTDLTVRAYYAGSGSAGTPAFMLDVSIWNLDGSAEVTGFNGDAGKYRFQVVNPDANLYELDAAFVNFEIIPAVYSVTFEGITVEGNADNTSGANTVKHNLLVKGDMPESVRAQIQYLCNGAAFDGTREYGDFTITAVLPQSANYSFTVNGQSPVDNKLEATLRVKRSYLAAGSAENLHQVILVAPEGFYADIKAAVTTPSFDRTVLRSYPIHSEFTLTVTGDVKDEKFVLYIPLNEAFYNEHASELSADDLYVYEPTTNKLVKANTNQSYKVTLQDGRFMVEGYNASQPITFVVAPEYNVPFWCSAPGIALIILIVLLLLVLMFYVGLVLLRIRANLKENEAVVIDTVGEAYEDEEIVVEGGEGPPAVDVDALAAETEEAEVEETAEDLEEATQEAVDVTIQELAEEEAAEEVVEEANEEAVEAIAVVDEDEDDNDDDDNDDDDDDEAEGFGSFGPAGLKYIDIKADPEGYEALLEQERQGLVTVVYRYRKSFTSRLIQSQGYAQDYYSAIKNRLLSYKGVKDRTSWNYDAFNRGRTHVAKINVKTKTVYLYLAINPEDLADTKYNFIDVSAKKKYATVPVLLKIKGDRKFKHALELIDMLCGEKLELKAIEGREDVDYRQPYKTADEMVEEGVMKKLAAGLPVEGAAPAEEAAPVEEAVAVDAPAEEATETEN